MKKTLLVLLSILLLSSMLLTSCDFGDIVPMEPETSATEAASSSTDTPQTPGENPTPDDNNNNNNNKIPDEPAKGYQFYVINKELRFAYPESWALQAGADGNATITDKATGNNISTLTGVSASVFQNITEKEYNTLIASQFKGSKVSLTKLKIKDQSNTLNTNVHSISAELKVDGKDVTQFIFAVNVNDNPYAISMTIWGKDNKLEHTVFNSLVALTPSEDKTPDKQDPNAPKGYTTYQNLNLRFAYPSDWTEDTSTVLTRFNGAFSELSLTTTAKNEALNMLTEELFLSLYAPSLGGEIKDLHIETKTNKNKLSVVLISFSITSDGITLYQQWYLTTIDSLTHSLILTTAMKDKDLTDTIFESLTKVEMFDIPLPEVDVNLDSNFKNEIENIPLPQPESNSQNAATIGDKNYTFSDDNHDIVVNDKVIFEPNFDASSSTNISLKDFATTIE